MEMNDYQRQSYMAIQRHANSKEEIMHWAIGLGEEAGETLSVVKHKYYGRSYNVEDMVTELGDVLWHIAAICTAVGLEMDDVARYNMLKLRHRYPTGQFDNQRSVERHKLEQEFKKISREREQLLKQIKSKIGMNKEKVRRT